MHCCRWSPPPRLKRSRPLFRLLSGPGFDKGSVLTVSSTLKCGLSIWGRSKWMDHRLGNLARFAWAAKTCGVHPRDGRGRGHQLFSSRPTQRPTWDLPPPSVGGPGQPACGGRGGIFYVFRLGQSARGGQEAPGGSQPLGGNGAGDSHFR